MHLIKHFSCSTGTRYGKKTAKACPSGSKFFHDGDNSVKNMDGHVLRLEYSCEREATKSSGPVLQFCQASTQRILGGGNYVFHFSMLLPSISGCYLCNSESFLT